MAQEPARSRAVGLIPLHVLERVPGFTPGGTAWATRLAGGTMNATYRVETSAGRFIARIHNPSAASLGADHEREARLHAAAAAAGLAPALIHVDAHFGFAIMEQVPGPTWVAEDFGRADRLGQLGAALHALHSVPAPTVAPFDLEASLVRLATRLTTLSVAEAPEVAQLMERARAALRLTGSSQRPAAIVHNDLYHGNLIGSDRLYLVDWEYAAVADPLLDLACVLAYYPQASPHRDTLMDSSRLGRVASPEMLGALTWLFMLVSWFWYRIRGLDGPVPQTDLAAERDLRARLG
jgi:aminoglycoside phosphotransferase (APT) family kinase protein